MNSTPPEVSVSVQIADCMDDIRWREARTAWKPPLVAYADAHDPLFERLKEVIGPAHLTPRELLPGAETVIVYFLPFRERVARSNRGAGPASEDWAIAYIETNELIDTINSQLALALERDGYAVVTVPPTHNFDEERLISNWSHKHAGYIAGLGTFGLHHMLITASGSAGRLGSLVTNARITPTPRPDHEACLYKHDGSCRACVERCWVGALQEDSFDRHKCYDICLDNARTYAELGLADVCGKCVSVVPCSFIDPVGRRINRSRDAARSR